MMLPEEAPARAHHDMGGVSRFTCEKVDQTHHEMSPFDREVDALRQVLGGTGLFTVDEMRRGIEGLGAETYDSSSYYQRWLYSMVTVMLEKGVITEAELRTGIGA